MPRLLVNACRLCGSTNLAPYRRCECSDCASGAQVLRQCRRCGDHGHYRPDAFDHATASEQES
jgi:hypothetical protein